MVSQITFNGRLAIGIGSRPRSEESVCRIVKDLGILSVCGKAVPDVALAYVYSAGIWPAVPDDIYTLKAIKVWMIQVQAQ